MITKIIYHNFPPIRKNEELELEQINLFVGINGTCKTRSIKYIGDWIKQGNHEDVGDSPNITVFFDDKESQLKFELQNLSFQAKNGDETSEIFNEVHYLIPSQQPLPSEFENRGTTSRRIDGAPYGLFVETNETSNQVKTKIKELFQKEIEITNVERVGQLPSIIRNKVKIDPKFESTGFASVFRMLIKLHVIPKKSLIVLDEPTAFLHTSLVKLFLDTVLEIVEKNEHQIVFIAHDLSAIMYFMYHFSKHRENLCVNKFENNSDYDAAILKIDHDIADGFLEDMFGVFPTKLDLEMLKHFSSFED